MDVSPTEGLLHAGRKGMQAGEIGAGWGRKGEVSTAQKGGRDFLLNKDHCCSEKS